MMQCQNIEDTESHSKQTWGERREMQVQHWRLETAANFRRSLGPEFLSAEERRSEGLLQVEHVVERLML